MEHKIVNNKLENNNAINIEYYIETEKPNIFNLINKNFYIIANDIPFVVLMKLINDLDDEHKFNRKYVLNLVYYISDINNNNDNNINKIYGYTEFRSKIAYSDKKWNNVKSMFTGYVWQIEKHETIIGMFEYDP
jgi:hypothetical protein